MVDSHLNTREVLYLAYDQHLDQDPIAVNENALTMTLLLHRRSDYSTHRNHRFIVCKPHSIFAQQNNDSVCKFISSSSSSCGYSLLMDCFLCSKKLGTHCIHTMLYSFLCISIPQGRTVSNSRKTEESPHPVDQS